MDLTEIVTRLSVMQFMIAKVTAEGFETEADMMAWTRQIDEERDKTAAGWKAKRAEQDPREQARGDRITALHARVWDEMLTNVRAHFHTLGRDAPDAPPTA